MFASLSETRSSYQTVTAERQLPDRLTTTPSTSGWKNENAKLTLKLSSASLSGSIMDGKREWHVSGKRTSGGDVRVAESR